MKKMTKLLSVILAFVMALSCMTMMASAAKASYRTVADLEKNAAYSAYGTVTRLSSEERLSILCDSLDTLLASANIKMDTVKVLWIEVRLNFTSLNYILDSLDSFYDAKGYLGIVGGTLKNLNLNSWQKGMTREGTAHETIVNEVLELLSSNTSAIGGILDSGLNLGLVGPFIKGLDLSGVNKAVVDLPGTIKSIILPLMGRQDDDADRRNTLGNKGSDLITVAQDFVNGLFTKKMAWTSYRTDVNGNDLGYTDPLPTSGTSRYFVNNGDGTITQYDYAYAGALGGVAGYNKTVTYTKAQEYEGSTTYVYKAPDDYSGDATLKWYKAENVADANGDIQSGYWLPKVKAAIESGALTLKINGDDTLLGLLYKFIPYVFDEMAPTVLNGSVKYELAKAFGVKFEKIGIKGGKDADKVTAEATATGNPGNFFTKAQDFYVWEYSDYKVINDVPYYRFQDTYFKGELPKDLSSYYNMFNWDWNISGNFLNEFIPSAPSDTANILDNFNKLIGKVINTVIKENWKINGKTYNRSEVFVWNNVGNDQLLNNVLVSARNFFKIAPEEVLDDYYKEAQFFDVMMNGTMEQAVNGLICELVKLIMPQIKFADNIINQPVTAIAAVVVRELCTQLMPRYNFDAMIYSNYGKAGAPTRELANHTADEWLNITLYMGVNLGMYYLRNIADLGEGENTGYFKVMQNLGALPALSGTGTDMGDAITFGADAYKTTIDGTSVASWLVAIDWIVDWALDENTEWCWHFGRLVNVDGEVNLATYQNPFNKIDKVLLTFFPELETLLNTSGLNGQDYGSGTWLEKILKDGLVDNIVSLNLPGLLNMLKIQSTSVLRRNNIANEAVKIVVNMLNKIFYKVAGGANLINSNTINSVATLLDQANLKTVVTNLVGKLYAASATHRVLDPILPIANFFIGWTTDAQKYGEPNISLSSSSGDNYLLKTSTNAVRVQNPASGMLQKHRNSTTVDKDYIITVQSITADNGCSVAVPEGGKALNPGEAYEFAITTPAGEGVTKLLINYTMTGKDGKPLGTDDSGNAKIHTKATYLYFTETADEEYVEGRLSCCEDTDYIASITFSKYTFTKDVFSSITEYKHSVYGTAAITNQSGKDKVFIRLKNDFPTSGKGAQYFRILEAESNTLTGKSGAYAGGWPENQNGTETVSGNLYAAKDGVTANTFTKENAEANNLYGLYDMGKVAIKYGTLSKKWIGSGYNESGHSVVVEKDFIFYNDFNIEDVMNKYKGYNLQAEDYTDSAKFTAYEDALKNVVKLATYPKLVNETTGYVATIQPQIPAAIEALEKAYKALVSTSTSSVSNIATLENALASVETNPDREINFQDYKLYEYFQYEKQRTSARNMINSTKAPAAPEKYVENGVWGDELVDAIVAAQQNANVKAGINATIVETSDESRVEEMKNYNQALADFVPAHYSNLQIADQSAKLKYYGDFMKANPKGNIDNAKVFLNNEIAYAEAQNYNPDDYSADSWARYTEALANAKKAQSSDKESLIFDAKYELMVAQNKLEKHSMKESGYLAEELIPLIEHANAIINNYGTLYSVKNGVAYADAFAQLVSALGVKYNVTIDGKTNEGILYDRSALTFTEYDRSDSAKNKRAVDAAADKLRAAIENFESAVRLDGIDGESTVDQSIRYIEGIEANSIPDAATLLSKVQVAGEAAASVTPVTQVSKAGHYGTGARVELKNGDVLLATYFVIIKGDVNGDGAVDAFDVIEVDLADKTAYYMGDVYDDAADSDGNGIIDATDYASVKSIVACAK